MLYNHQKEILERFPHKHALVWGTGSGKTRTAIELVKKSGGSAIFICPKALTENWKNEIKKWGPIGSHIVISKETFRRDWDDLPKVNCLVIDEGHYFLSMSSQMMKSLMKYIKKTDPKYIWLLSATIYRSSPWDIYKLCEIMGDKLNYWKFRDRFFYYVRMGYREIPMVKKGIEADIAKLVRKVGSIVRLEDCVDVPEQVFDTEYFELTKEQKKAMDNITDIEPIVRFTKEHQICGGTLKGDEYTEDVVFESHKKDRLVDICADNDRVIVVCRYNNEIKELAKLLNTNLIISGEVSAERRHEIVESLKIKDKYIVLVNAACSEGWEAPSCPLMVFYSLSFSLKDMIQMMGRIQRINNIKKNTYLSLVVKDTIDEDVFDNIFNKKMDFHIEIYNNERA